jgi:hypothetical protein
MYLLDTYYTRRSNLSIVPVIYIAVLMYFTIVYLRLVTITSLLRVVEHERVWYSKVLVSRLGSHLVYSRVCRYVG